MVCKPLACAGELRHLVSVQTPTRSPDGFGGFSNSTWTTAVQVWCKIEQISGSEKFAHVRLETQATHKFTTRYVPDIVATQRLLFDGRAFNIRNVNNVNENSEWLIILAEEGVVD